MAVGLTLQAAALAWPAEITVTDVAYGSLVLPFILGGVCMGMYYAPVSFVELQSVWPEEALETA